MGKVVTVHLNFCVDRHKCIKEAEKEAFEYFSKAAREIPELHFTTLSVVGRDSLHDPWKEVLQKYSPEKSLF